MAAAAAAPHPPSAGRHVPALRERPPLLSRGSKKEAKIDFHNNPASSFLPALSHVAGRGSPGFLH